MFLDFCPVNEQNHHRLCLHGIVFSVTDCRFQKHLHQHGTVSGNVFIHMEALKTDQSSFNSPRLVSGATHGVWDTLKASTQGNGNHKKYTRMTNNKAHVESVEWQQNLTSPCRVGLQILQKTTRWTYNPPLLLVLCTMHLRLKRGNFAVHTFPHK